MSSETLLEMHDLRPHPRLTFEQYLHLNKMQMIHVHIKLCKALS